MNNTTTTTTTTTATDPVVKQHDEEEQDPIVQPQEEDADVTMEDVECKDGSDGSVSVDTTDSSAKPSPMDEDQDELNESATADDVDTQPKSAMNDGDTDMKDADAATEGREQPDGDEDDAYDGPTIDLAALMNVEDLSADQKKLMENRLGTLQEDYKESVQRQRELRLQEIKNGFKFNVDVEITDQEASFIHDFCKKHQFDVMEKIEDEGVFFLTSIREMLDERQKQRARGLNAADRKKKRNRQRRRRDDGDGSGSEYEFDLSDIGDDSDDSDYCGSDMETLDDLLNDQTIGDVDDSWSEEVAERKKRRAARRSANAKKGHKLNGEKRCGRLLLDDALKDKENQDGWSEARIKAYEQRETNPNSYYYRFNDPGEKQGHGNWTKAEQKLFMERLMECGANVKWGVFSMAIPGRVGYQCSNYYRQLIQTGQVTDPNYSVSGNKLSFRRGGLKDKKGRSYSRAQSESYKQYAFIVQKDPTGVWTNLPARHPKCPKFILTFNKDNGDATEDAPPAATAATAAEAAPKKSKPKKAKKGKKRRKKNDSDDDAEPARKRRRTDNKREEKNDPSFTANVSVDTVDPENPLPELIDMITNLPVVQPAISPFGHVLGYQTWTKILRQEGCRNTCPFTKQKLTRRQLTKLTHENIDEFKSQIVNVTTEEMANLQIS